MITIILILLFINLLVAVHELGHLVAAKSFGIQAEELSVGMGKKIYSVRSKDGCQYSFRVLPIGGYVRFKGEQLDNSKPLTRLIIASAGVVVNIVLAFVILLFTINSTPRFQKHQGSNLSKTIKALSLMTSEFYKTDTQVGALTDTGVFYKLYNRVNDASTGFALAMVGVCSFLMGLLNLLPIPPLDGGRILLTTLELIRGKTLSETLEAQITLVGGIIIAGVTLWFVFIGFV